MLRTGICVLFMSLLSEVTSQGQFEPEVTPECQELGYCSNVPNYPTEHVQSLLTEFADIAQWFQLDTINSGQQARRMGGVGSQKYPLCDFTEQVLYPFAAPDENKEWHEIINSIDRPVQGFSAEICNPLNTVCSDIAMIQPTYNSSCVQKFTFRKVAVINKADGKPTQKSLRLPSCCSCLAYPK